MSGAHKDRSNFSTIGLSQVPHGRHSKHSEIVNRILVELWDLDRKSALRVSRQSFDGEKLSNVRAAVSRAVKKHGLDVTTSTDDEYFYLWFDGDGQRPKGTPPPKVRKKSGER